MKFEISPLGVLALGLWLDELDRCPRCGSVDTQQDRANRADLAFRECLAAPWLALGCGSMDHIIVKVGGLERRTFAWGKDKRATLDNLGYVVSVIEPC